MKDWADEHDILLVGRTDPRVVGQEHIPVFDARILRPVLKNPLHLGVSDTRHILHVGAKVDELSVFSEDGRVEI